MAQQKRPTRPVTQTPDPATSFDAPRWYGPDGTLISGRLEPSQLLEQPEIEPLTPGGELPDAAGKDAALDTHPEEGVG